MECFGLLCMNLGPGTEELSPLRPGVPKGQVQVFTFTQLSLSISTSKAVL